MAVLLLLLLLHLLLLLLLLGLLGGKAIEGYTNGRAMTPVASGITGHKMAGRGVITLFVFTVFAGDIAEVTHVAIG
jgi:hypothetical protein